MAQADSLVVEGKENVKYAMGDFEEVVLAS